MTYAEIFKRELESDGWRVDQWSQLVGGQEQVVAIARKGGRTLAATDADEMVAWADVQRQANGKAPPILRS